MRTCIYGAGSLGTVLGAYISENGMPIDLVNRNAAHVRALNESGAHITGKTEKNIPVHAITPDQMEGTYDVIFLLTKQLNNREVVSWLKDYLSTDGVICTLQNGIPEPLIASIIGSNRTIGCTVEWGATLLSPGVAELTSDPCSMSFHMGRMPGITDEQLNKVKEILELMCPVDIEDNLLGARWTKLLINATFSGLGTVLGGNFGSVSATGQGREVAIRVMKECIDVGHSMNVTFAPVQGKDIIKLFYYQNGIKKCFGKLLMPIAMKKHKAIVPSMLQDIQKGKPCEIDAINGVVCEFGKTAGVPTPFNDKIVSIIKDIEAGTISATDSNIGLFDDLLK